MASYTPHPDGLRYGLKDVAGLGGMVSKGTFPGLNGELVDTVLEEIAR